MAGKAVKNKANERGNTNSVGYRQESDLKTSKDQLLNVYNKLLNSESESSK
jgi:hypothetical protein